MGCREIWGVIRRSTVDPGEWMRFPRESVQSKRRVQP